MHSKKLLGAVLASLSLVLVSRADITTGLVLKLDLNETTGTTTADSSGIGNNATLINFPGDNSQWTTGWLNGGIQINNPQTTPRSYLTIPDAPSLNFNTGLQFTLATWVKMPPAQVAGAGLIAKGTGGGGEQYDLDINASKFRIVTRIAAATAVTLSSAANISSNWTHVAVAWDGATKSMRMYVNGQLSAVTTNNNLAGVVANSHPVTIGAREANGTSGYTLAVTNTFMDDVRIYNRALSANDVFELFATGGYGNPNGILPTVTTPPRNITNYTGDMAVFSVAAGGTPPFFYQWLSNNVPMINATNATLILSNVQPSWSASYSVAVTNIIGATTSPSGNLQVQPLPAPNITDNLVGYWKFDDASGSSTAVDSSGNANSGALTGFNDISSCWVTGITNGALNFNGDASTANLVAIPGVGTPAPNVLDFSANPVFAMAAWVKAPSVQTNGGAIICKGTGAGGEQLTVDMNAGKYRFYVRNISGTVFTINTAIAPNDTWQHLVAVLDAINGNMNFYVNGQLVGAAVAPLSLSTNAIGHEVSIGNRQSGAATAYNLPFTGAIDDVRIYSRALTSADIQALYLTGGVFPPDFVSEPSSDSFYVGDNVTLSTVASGTLPIKYQWSQNAISIPGATNASLILTNLQLTNAGTYTLFATNSYGSDTTTGAVIQVSTFFLTNALAGHWKFDDGSGSTAVDSSVNSNHGFLTGFVGDGTEWVSGRLGKGLNFNADALGANYVAIPDAPSLNFVDRPQFTLSAWVRCTPAQANGAAIIAKGTGGGGEQYALDVYTGLYRFYVRSSAGAASTLLTSGTPSGTWQHVVATFDSSTGAMCVYVNGQLVGSMTGPTSLLTSSHEVSIGNRQSAAAAYNLPLTGMIDDARIYRRALNAFDVQQLYSSAGSFSPVIYSLNPVNVSALAGDTVTFTASADGDAPLSYQWLKGVQEILGATNQIFSKNNVQLGDAGGYTFRVSNGAGAATSNVVLQVASVPLPDTTSSLRAYWNFNETSGTVAADSSGNGNSVTLYGFLGDDSQWTPGRIGNALHFNAGGLSDQLAGTDNPLTLENGNFFSFSFWAKLDPGATGVNPRIISPSTEHWVLWSPNRGVGLYTPANSTEPSSNLWNHFVVTYDRLAKSYSLYVNGVREVANAMTYPKADPTGAFWVMGHSEVFTTTTDSWRGLLDEMRVYNRILNVNDARALYFESGQPPVSIQQNGNAITVAWSVAASGFQLQSTDDLGGSWANVTDTPVIAADGISQSITINTGNGAKFYRLHK